MLRIFLCGSLTFLGLFACCDRGRETKGANASHPAPPKLRTLIRRPIAVVSHCTELLVANRESGTLSVIAKGSGQVLSEHPVAKRIADMVRVPYQQNVLILDDDEQTLLKVAWHTDSVQVLPLANMPAAGTKLVLDRNTQTVSITSQWAHRVWVYALNKTYDRVEKSQSIKLPFAPREVLLLDENTLLVAEAFGSRLAVLDTKAGKLSKMHSIEGHNIRGLAKTLDGQSVLIAHQHMPKQALADYEELHWGRLLKNAVRVVTLKSLLDPDSPTQLEGWLDAHGGIGSASGDPSGVVAGTDGVLAVAFSGVGEVAVNYRGTQKRIPVQNRPEAIIAAGGNVYVANRFSDSISVINLKQGQVVNTISLGPRPELTSEQRGEMLFFNAKLSHDGWMSCQSCHTDGHTSGRVVDTLGDGDYGAPKLVPSLLGTGDTRPWAWDGSSAMLRPQIQKSLTSTMHGDPLSAREMEDMVAYLTSLEPPPPVERLDPQLIAKGRDVFQSNNCVNCHAPPAYTTPVTVDVSLLDELKRSRFNPPSLRGVSQRPRYFHDGRAESLEQVVLKIQHQLEEPLTPKDAKALLAFLRSL